VFYHRTSSERTGQHLRLAGTDGPNELQGYVYCAALSVFRAVDGAGTASEVDHLFGALANLEVLGRSLHVAGADLADIARWKQEVEEKLCDFRRREQFQQAGSRPAIELQVGALGEKPVRESA
jgi:hypothetical protein